MARVPNQQNVIQTGEGEAPAQPVVEQPAAECTAVVRQYVVVKGGKISAPDGYMTRLREGKIVDDANYNIARLRSQGIKLADYVPDVDG